MDSGAAETVINEDMVISAITQEGTASNRVVAYEVANGVHIPNLGDQKFVGVSNEGISRKLTAHVCEVNKGLLSVSKVTIGGSRWYLARTERTLRTIARVRRCTPKKRTACI